MGYLEKDWTTKEIFRLERHIENFISRIKQRSYFVKKQQNIRIFGKEWWTKIIILLNLFIHVKNN